MRRVFFAAFLLFACSPHRNEIDVSAAISLRDALTDVAAAYERQTHVHVVFNFAGSNVLARQIRAGAPVDIFFPADERTMSSVNDLVEERMSLLSNRLVVVSNVPIGKLDDLKNCGRIALGDPSSVPAGVYARKALEEAELWDDVASKVIPTENVRAALAAVDGGNVDAAIVYETDARMTRHAKHVFVILDGPEIVYPVAVLRTAPHKDAAYGFFGYLKSLAAAQIFRQYGFLR